MERQRLEVIRFVKRTDPLPEGFLTVEQTARYVGLSDERIRQLIDEGRLQARRQKDTIGREGWRWLVDTGEATRFKKVRETDPRRRR